MRLKPIAVLLSLLLSLASLPARSAESLSIYAAASLTNALNAVIAAFGETHPTRVIANYASSSTLARQIAQGAPADLYISANLQWMDYLTETGVLADDSRRTLLGNRLVLVTGTNSALVPVELDQDWNLAGALGDSRLALGDPDHVPAGRYAKEALQWLGLWPVAEPRLARANNVRGALALVERGEAPLGIVYGSDAASARVRVLAEFPARSHSPIDYPIAIVRSADRPAARELLAFLSTPQATDIFRRYGFEVR
ncbi:molybdate ABC transporter substrate-binding protein [Marinobacterium aestuarii]|uniref:Molybdate ABC transporter substrate-binding protein n=1 Tax=Marinobacterium aestuarii TaxID=1821621 RepID=A0A1A9EX40_9GAMM|nr:molybdate ABC transporter substrate-binding protein [Marinobacterium aestuarii]ANG62382.1 molybdate ABC transporter substrate-binding protein [Marinobacterium aestuarii]